MEQALLASISNLAHVLPIRGLENKTWPMQHVRHVPNVFKTYVSLPERSGEAVEVLQTPEQFFHALLAGLASAQRHVAIAALYIGTEGGREAEFVAALAAAARDAGRRGLEIEVLLDALRSTRPTKAADGTVTSTAEMLGAALLGEQTVAKVNVSLFHTPALRGLLRRLLPPRVREVVGVQHIKAACFDDTVIITGANLSNTYFSTRQDRYLLVRGAPELARFVRQAVRTVGQFSYQLMPGGEGTSCGAGGAGGQRAAGAAAAGAATAAAGAGAGTGLQGSAGTLRRALLARAFQQPGYHSPSPGSQSANAAWSGSRAAARLAPPPHGLDPARHAGEFGRSLRAELLRLFVPAGGEAGVLDPAVLAVEEEGVGGDMEGGGGRAHIAAAVAAASRGESASQGLRGPQEGSVYMEGNAAAATKPLQPQPPAATAAAVAAAAEARGDPLGARGEAAADTWLVPLVQAGFVGVRQEERCTLGMLRWAAQHGAAQAAAGAGAGRPLLQVSTPYLNLARPFEWALAQARQLDLELLTSSPEANGFFGSRGMSGYIPQAYSLLEHRTWRRLTRHERAAPAGWRARLGRQQHRQQQLWRYGDRWWQQGSTAAAAVEGWRAEVPQLPGGRRLAGAPQAGVGAPAAEAQQAQQHGSRRLLEFTRPGWEFHAKGLWFTPPGAAGPTVTAAGSSNLGFRSQHRDLELQFLVVTANPRLQAALGEEFGRLRQHAAAVGESHFLQPGRRGGALARAAVRLLRGFL